MEPLDNIVSSVVELLEAEPSMPGWRRQELFEPLYMALSGEGRIDEFQRRLREELDRRPGLKKALGVEEER